MVRIFILFIFLWLGNNSNAYSEPTPLPSNQWQSTTGGNQQKLSIRHKMIVGQQNERDYEAQFIVYNKDAKEKYTKTISVKKDNWGRVYFPDDFLNEDGSQIKTSGGNYIWNVVVENEVVVFGSFSNSIYLFDKKIDLREIN